MRLLRGRKCSNHFIRLADDNFGLADEVAELEAKDDVIMDFESNSKAGD